MKHNVTLTIMSLLAALLASLHLSDDVARGFERGGPSTYNAIFILVVWLYATLVLAERRAGHIIILVGSILGAGVPYLHMRGAGMVGGRVANTSGMLFWVWTLLALGATSMLSAILAAHGLWSLGRNRSR